MRVKRMGRRRGSALLLFILALNACLAGDGSDTGANAPPGSFAWIQINIFDVYCIGCHGVAAAGDLNLTSPGSYDRLVNIPSSEQPALFRIEPDNPDDSYLLMKVRGDEGITGSQMPADGPPFLSNEEIEAIEQWILDGAPETSPAERHAFGEDAESTSERPWGEPW